MTLDPVFRDLASGPDFYLKEVDLARDVATFAPMTEEGFAASSFLDNRIRRQGDTLLDLPLAHLIELGERIKGLGKPTGFLFHIGHCGSTLVSRLLGALPGVLSLREPEPLRALSAANRAGAEGWRDVLPIVLALLSRTHRPGSRAVVKPSSFCNDLIEPILAHDPGNRAVFLYIGLADYLATMMKDQNRQETEYAMRTFHAADVAGALGDPELDAAALPNARKAALIWAINMGFLARARAGVAADRIVAVDFDDFLADRTAALTRIASALGLGADPAEIARAARRPRLNNRYSKHPTEVYDQSSRARELAETRARHGAEIDDALSWLGDYTARNELLGPVRANLG